MSAEHPEVDLYLQDGCGRCKDYQTPQCKVHTWSGILKALRRMALDSGLEEMVKWSQPCYTLDGGNVLLVTAFRDYACLSFFKGVLLEDPHGLLVAPGDHSQAVRQVRFTEANQVIQQAPALRQLIEAAMEVERKKQKPVLKKQPDPIPEALQEQLDADPELMTAFRQLTPGRQRSYILHISQARQHQTALARIARCKPKILAGIGFHERL